MNMWPRKIIGNQSPLIENIRQLRNLDRSFIQEREMPTALLMASIGGFEVKVPINHWMHGNEGKINRQKALEQWVDLYATLSEFCLVEVVESVKEYEDMVFIANAGLTVKKDGKKLFVRSNMKHPARWGESPHYEEHMAKRGYEIIRLPDDVLFEGQGDALWHPKKILLYCGHGHRSTVGAYESISKLLNVPVVLLELVSKYYHLDTCFCPVDEQTVLYYPDAFTREGQRMIEHMFQLRCVVTKEEAETFACNSIVVGKNIVMPKGDEAISSTFEKLSYKIHFREMSEFIKSGGAAKCCVLEHY